MLRFGEAIIGITAEHVVQQYEAARTQTPNLVCQLGNTEFDLANAIIDRDDDLDIATFTVSFEQLKRSKGVALDCTGAWPPPAPDHMRAITLVGFPEQTRIVRPDLGADFAAYGALGAVDDVNDRDILVTYDPSRDQMMMNAVPAAAARIQYERVQRRTCDYSRRTGWSAPMVSGRYDPPWSRGVHIR